jgi:NADPH:quinone reductase
MTVEYLLNRTFKVTPASTILFHAAAGGVGLIACQWAKAIGATMIGTVSSPEKAALAKANGCTQVINYRTENFVERVKEITGGKLCDVVYDSIGKDTFMQSLDCVRPRGVVALFGQASGPVPPLDLGVLGQKGSLYVTRPSLMTYTAAKSELEASARALFEMVGSGKVKIKVNQTYPLSRVAEAHADLEMRRTTGSTLLIPER